MMFIINKIILIVKEIYNEDKDATMRKYFETYWYETEILDSNKSLILLKEKSKSQAKKCTCKCIHNKKLNAYDTNICDVALSIDIDKLGLFSFNFICNCVYTSYPKLYITQMHIRGTPLNFQFQKRFCQECSCLTSLACF